MARRRQSRRGVLLLIVLSLLVLFVLVGMTFIVSAGGFKDMADASAKTGITGMDGAQIANSTLNQILHGTKNPLSNIRGHSLLEDLYGRDYFVGRVVPNAGNGQAYATTTDNQLQTIGFDFLRWGNVPPTLLRDDYYGGCVITFISGEATGKTARITRYQNTGAFRRIELVGVLGSSANGAVLPAIQANDMFVVNGRPFNGTGAGFSTPDMTPMGLAGKLNNAMQMKPFSGEGPYAIPVALMPNYSAYQFEDFNSQRDHAGLEEIAYGGLDESYDAVDFQNMAMAKVPARVNEITQSDPTNVFFTNTGGIIPSFHRPYLMTYIARNFPGVLQDPQLRRAFLFRPNAADHPSFTGSNPLFNQDQLTVTPAGLVADGEGDGLPDGWFVGPWDVDNDGDGVPDSIWMDLGHDPITGKDGKLYKPLVAALIMDMDGKINVNTAGSLQQAIALSAPQIEIGAHAIGPVRPDGTKPIKPNLMGGGFGAADVNPAYVYNNVQSNYEQILRRRYLGVAETFTTSIDSSDKFQFVSNAQPGDLTTLDEDDIKFQNYRIPGNSSVPDRFARADQINNGVLAGVQTSLQTGYGSLPDLAGRGIPFITPNGGLGWVTGGAQAIGMADDVDDPYEMDPLHHNSRDNPFSIEDLDYLVRFEDSRAQGRLREINDTSNSISPFRVYSSDELGSTRGLFTTHSVHIPAIPSLNPGKWRHGNELPGSTTSQALVRGEGMRRSVREMFTGKIFRHLQLENPQAEDATLEQTAFTLAGNLLPPQLARGEKLDLNQALQGTDLLSLARKRAFATHLFHLMMLLTDDEVVMPVGNGAGLTPEQQRELHVRRIAQWAINVVDFGDADSAMTYFEYDVNPFNSNVIPALLSNPGSPIGPPHPEARRIFGCEHPELVLSETMAIHDRRVEDSDSLGGPREQNGSVRDPDLDQRENPQASTFIELLCMRGMSQANGDLRTYRVASERGPEDLYLADELAGRYMPMLNLAQLDSLGNPVWQLAISERQMDAQINPLELREQKPEETSFNPDNFSLLPNATAPQVKIARRVWFHTPTGNTPEDVFFTQDYAYRTTAANKGTKLKAFPQPMVEPGMYVVIGPEAVTNLGLKKTGAESDQRVNLIDPTNRDTQSLAHTNLEGFGLRTSVPSRALTLVAKNVAQNGRRTGLNISAPIDGYSSGPTDLPKDSPENPTDAEDAPLWYSDDNLATDENPQLVTGVRPGFRTVYLQRLANPLLPLNENPVNPNYNPYISIDWMPIDLTVFNSADEEPSSWSLGEPFDPQDPTDHGLNDNNEFGLIPLEFDTNAGAGGSRNPIPGYFASREKSGGLFGDSPNGPIVGQNLNIWSSRSEMGRATGSPAAGSSQYTQSTVNASHTLGWLNRTFDVVPPNTPLYNRDALGHYTEPGLPYSETPNTRIGTRSRTFPSLVWNNRPYANEYELMLVPACSQSRLSQEYTTSRPEMLANGLPRTTAGGALSPQPVNVNLAGNASRLQNSNVYKGAFGHLLNFFNSTPGSVEESQFPQNLFAGNFHRIFDFVTVPSRFRGTETYLNEQTYTANANSGVPRKISNFREPGRINVNTAYDASIWQALTGKRFSNSFKEFENAMAGALNGVPFNNALLLGESTSSLSRYPTGDYPSEYPYPYRASVSADLVPPFVTGGSQKPVLRSVEASLLRTSNAGGTGNAAAGDPAFARFYDPDPSTDGFGEKHQNRQSNAHFRYRDLIKLGGSTTSQSNVYSIWLTVSFFEIEPNYPVTKRNDDGSFAYDVSRPYHVDAAHPDGYRFGPEMGSELGNVERHRSFYIIDRSIPVAFEPGVNHNTDDAILLRRHLE